MPPNEDGYRAEEEEFLEDCWGSPTPVDFEQVALEENALDEPEDGFLEAFESFGWRTITSPRRSVIRNRKIKSVRAEESLQEYEQDTKRREGMLSLIVIWITLLVLMTASFFLIWAPILDEWLKRFSGRLFDGGQSTLLAMQTNPLHQGM